MLCMLLCTVDIRLNVIIKILCVRVNIFDQFECMQDKIILF